MSNADNAKLLVYISCIKIIEHKIEMG